MIQTSQIVIATGESTVISPGSQPEATPPTSQMPHQTQESPK